MTQFSSFLWLNNIPLYICTTPFLLECCPQYASKFGKLYSGHRTGKRQFSFQSQRKAMPKNVQTTAQLHSSKIPWMEEPGRLQSMGSLRVRNNRETSLSLFTFMHWRRKWQPTPVFLPGEFHGQRSLVGYIVLGVSKSQINTFHTFC